jgi:hypothetical protein
MKARTLTVLLLGIASFSCDKVKNIAGKARTVVESKIPQKAAEPGTKPDPELQKLVDQTDEGAVFRKDLPFPGQLEVKTTRRHEVSGRFTESSAIGNQAAVIKGTQTTITKLERAGDQVRYTMMESTFAEPVVGTPSQGEDAKKPEVKQLAPPSAPVVFRRLGNAWKADNSQGFRAIALSQELSPVFDQLLVENALAPHPLWFGKKRIKVGEQISVADQSLPMLVAGGAKGSLKLTLKSFEAVQGHPCGVFEVTGNYTRKQAPDFEGRLTDEEVTVQSGKLWLSLIYPIVLKEELDTIQTTHAGGFGGPPTRGQGSVKVSVTREWKSAAK